MHGATIKIIYNNYFIAKTKYFGFIKLLNVSVGSAYYQDSKNKYDAAKCLSFYNCIKIGSLYNHYVIIHNQPSTCNDIYKTSPFSHVCICNSTPFTCNKIQLTSCNMIRYRGVLISP